MRTGQLPFIQNIFWIIHMLSFWLLNPALHFIKHMFCISYAPVLTAKLLSIFSIAPNFIAKIDCLLFKGLWLLISMTPQSTAIYWRKIHCRNWKRAAWTTTWRYYKLMVFCEESMAIPLYTSLPSSSMSKLMKTVFIDETSSDSSSYHGWGWLVVGWFEFWWHLLHRGGAKISVFLSAMTSRQILYIILW